MGGGAPSDVGGWPEEASDGPPRARKRAPFPWFRTILVVGVAALLLWAATSPGGIRARLTGIDSSLSGAISQVTKNRDLENATKMFDGWYQQQGRYPNYTQAQLDQSATSWGAGMDVAWCTPRAVVLTSLTASGTVSRLLLDGQPVGDVSGRVACPADLVNPLPWKR